MKGERWEEVERIYRSALERQPSDREEFVAEVCAGDELLRRDVESLLRSNAPTLEIASKAGQRLGSYEVLSALGAGGMGEIYRARDSRLDREVAIKLLPDHLAGNAEALERFQREARILAALSHPNILAIHDVGVDRGVFFVVTELLEGQTLRSRLKHGPIPWRLATEMVAAIADGLAAAHAKGIVHRDLKPENVILTSDGRLKILDFGIALKSGPHSPGAAEPQAAESALTQPGVMIGTIGYMSPEQICGRRVDSRSDVFSLGCILYEVLTGVRAFGRASAQETVAAILNDPPPSLSTLGIDLPKTLEELIARCLEKRPADRVLSARDVALVLRGLSVSASSRPGRKRWLAPAAVSLAVGLAVAGWVLRERPRREPAAPLPLTSYSGDEVQPAFSPDGNQVVFVWDGEQGNNPDLYVKLIGGSEKPLRLTSNPAPDLSPAWSPDGRSIAFVRFDTGGARKNGVFVMPAIGGPERIAASLGAPLKSPAGLESGHRRIAPFPLIGWAGSRNLVITDHSSVDEPLALFLLSLETGEKRRLTSPPPGFIGDSAPVLSPDGGTLLFSRAADLTVSELYQLPLTAGLRPAGDPQQLTADNSWNMTPAWLPGGRDFVFSRGTWHAGPFSLWWMPAVPGGIPHRLPAVTEDSSFAAIAPNGRRLVFSQGTRDSNIWRVQMHRTIMRGTPERLVASTRDDVVPQYSSDGRKVVFTSNRTGVHEVWIANSDGSDPVQLTSFGRGLAGSPHWSPDGAKIVFDSNSGGQFEVYIAEVTGGQPRRLTNNPADDALASFSPDGRFVYFTSNRTRAWQVWRMLADGTDQVQITRAGGRAPIVSSDGKRLWYEKVGAGLWNMPLPGGEETQILESVGFLNTAITGNGVYFVPRCGGTRCDTIKYLELATGSIRTIMHTNAKLGEGLTLAPDGSALLYTQIDQSGRDLILIEALDLH